MRNGLATSFLLVLTLGLWAPAAGATSIPITRCNAEVVWTNPNPGVCVSVVIQISVQDPDSNVNLTTTGQDGGGAAINLGAGGQHHFHTKYDTITAHEVDVNVTIVFVTD